MATQHSVIPDAERHEPKGASTAAIDTAYLSDGAGSGSWIKVQKAQAACMKASSSTATTGITTAFQAINNALLGGTIIWSENNNEALTLDTTSGYIQVPETGMYNITYTASILPATNGSEFEFTFGIQQGAGAITPQENYVRCIITTSGTVDTKIVSFACLPNLTANAKVYIMTKETTDGEEFTLQCSNFTVTRVA